MLRLTTLLLALVPCAARECDSGDFSESASIIPTDCTALDLSESSIDSDGATALAEALPKATQLTTLNLRYNAIGASGAIALAGALPAAPQLTTLNVRFNSIGAAGA